MMEQAVIDRFEGEYAILIVGSAQKPLDVPRSLLPANACEGHWVRLEINEGEIVKIEIDEQATHAAHERIQAKLARLRRGDHLH
jgi:hypothetical protein